MKREELAQKLARQSNLSRAAARDQVDELVHRILKSLRDGQPVELPGVGRLVAERPLPRRVGPHGASLQAPRVTGSPKKPK